MGQFSWLDCKTKEQILVNNIRPVYVLIPKEFGGGHIEENNYDGYGIFGGEDIFELVAGWNHNDIPTIINLIKDGVWKGSASENEIENMYRFYKGEPFEQSKNDHFPFELRTVGIIIAAWDEDNRNLKYPIKITYDKNAVYEDCTWSADDPNQGWLQEEVEDNGYDNLLWNILKKHRGHKIEIASYGDWDNPESITLEDTDTNEVILDGGIYTLCAREDC